MARSRLCRSCGDFHDLALAWPQDCASHFGEQATDPGFYLIRDGMDPFVSHASGRMHDSKSQYRRELKAMGCIEVGNEPIRARAPVAAPPVGDSLRQTLQQLRN